MSFLASIKFSAAIFSFSESVGLPHISYKAYLLKLFEGCILFSKKNKFFFSILSYWKHYFLFQLYLELVGKPSSLQTKTNNQKSEYINTMKMFCLIWYFSVCFFFVNFGLTFVLFFHIFPFFVCLLFLLLCFCLNRYFNLFLCFCISLISFINLMFSFLF